MPRWRRLPGGVVSRALAVGLSILLSLGFAATARGDAISDKQNQKSQQQGLISSLQSQIAAAQSREALTQAQIAAIAAQVAATLASIASEQAKLDKITAALATEKAQLAATEAQLAMDKHTLADQARILYEASDQSTPLNNLVGAGSFNEFWVKLLDTRRVAAQEQDTVAKVNRLKQQVADQVALITGQQHEQQAVVVQLHGQEAQLAAQQAAQVQLEQQLQAQIADDQRRMAEAEAAVAQLNAQIAQLQAEQAAAAAAAAAAARRHGHPPGTRFVWPESGPISQGFGCTPFWFEQWDPNCPSRHFHNGLDIAAGCGNPIGATAAGFAHTYWSNWGFGHYIIVVHGNGWASLYGHMSTFTVADGQWVNQGQQIGWEGSSGNSTGCHLHFGISSDGSWVNPLDVLP